MNNRRHLPIGTIVRLVGGTSDLMIVSLFPVTDKGNVKGYFDFAGTTLPIGLLGDKILFFNKEDIEEVVFVGYIDISFQELDQRYDELVDKIEYPRFSITDFKQ
ncbi:DUF4176 domain-containing protein [Streptococcus pluranimalium]|uniref:DUF4176 domain-containing protein n=1 Tax=Streptococcus pluranimalium TaxID=82348 RepID=A0A345VJJ6_9STRE|nr:DUF4176 domain-containing protein [Streptococcus pluranimalium]AXJ12898.1 hypothetical protein Sp14A_09770 [Streptococcus pluranimalium]